MLLWEHVVHQDGNCEGKKAAGQGRCHGLGLGGQAGAALQARPTAVVCTWKDAVVADTARRLFGRVQNCHRRVWLFARRHTAQAHLLRWRP